MINPTMHWFLGVIESVDDPERINRVKVRAAGYHTEDKSRIPTADLPWAPIITNTVNMSSPNYVQGDWVVGFFLDGERGQQPVVFGIIHGIPREAPNPDLGFNDPDGIYPNRVGEPTTPRNVNGENIDQTNVAWQKNTCALGISKADGSTWSEPTTQYAAEYSKNHVIQTPAYNMIELDDTQSAERVHIFHRKGTFIEMHPDGQIVIRSMGNKNVIVNGDTNIYSTGDTNITSVGNANILANGNTNFSTGGNVSWKVGGTMRFDIGGNLDFAVKGDWNVGAGGTGRQFAGGNMFIEGAKVYLADGISNPVGDAQPPIRSTATSAPLFDAEVGADDNDSREANEARASGQAAAGIKPKAPEEVFTTGQSASPAPGNRPAVAQTPANIDRKNVYDTRLGKYYTLGDLTRGAADGRRHDVFKAKSGLSGEQIIANLKSLCENVLDPLRDAGVKFNINSCFRDDSNSNHGIGCAVDLGFNGISSAFQGAQRVYEVVGGNLFQCFLEYSTNTAKSGWLHVAYVPAGQQGRGARIKPGTGVVAGASINWISRSAFVDQRPRETARFDGSA